MSTPEQPATPPLTRKQLREIRNTGSNPVIPPAADATESDDEGARVASETPATANPAPVSAAPLPRPAEPADVPPPPVADSAVDLGVSPLTRRQARQQERIRTASVPVITPEVIAAHAGGATIAAPVFAFPGADPATGSAPAEVERAGSEAAETEGVQEDGTQTDSGDTKPAFGDGQTDAEATTDGGLQSVFAPTNGDAPPAPDESAVAFPWTHAAAALPEPLSTGPAPEVLQESSSSAFDELPAAPIDSVLAATEADGTSDDDADERAKAVVNPMFGAGLLGGAAAVSEPAAELPPSFDELLSRSSGSTSTPNALIVSQAPEVSPLVAPVTATGEVLVTGTFNLPEGLGSMGHARGTADGKEIDATLIDGELPSHSSPTPIAASAAVSTVKTPGEVIKPPAPEKGSRLMMSLAITAGVLALALVGVLILAFVTGVF